MPAARYLELRFVLHPASRIVHSRYPIVAIWRLHQTNSSQEVVDLDAGAIRLLVIRRHQEVELEPLSHGKYAMLSALAAGDPLAAAAEAAFAVNPEFDIARGLRDHVARRTIVGFYF
ncbi:MAG: hypothetical protein EXR86_05960 [Gammaproteobacteria bacterium]|nr:hypothetical protein [Gammaproteobacteria bacterium]